MIDDTTVEEIRSFFAALILLAVRDLSYPEDSNHKSAKPMIGDETYRLVLGRLRLSLKDIVEIIMGTEHVRLDALRVLAKQTE
jgi:hypothetical protein